jgi:hypothetical protein
MKRRTGNEAGGMPIAVNRGQEAKMKQWSRRHVGKKVAWLSIVAVAAVVLGGGAALATQGPLPLPGPATSLPPAKAQEWERLQQEMVAARAHLRPKPASQAPSHIPDPQRHAGIDDAMHQGPFSATDFTVRNFWQGPVGPNWVLVYAGAKRESAGSAAAQGALRLYNEPTDANGDYHLVPIGTYLAPGTASALTITAVHADVLSLRTAAGSTLSFNLQTHQYQ